MRLPQGIDLGVNFSYTSAPPFSAFLGDTDLNGDGTRGDLLPGTTVNAFNRGMGRAQLEQLVAGFKNTHADRALANPALPARYSLGDNFHSLDVRLTRSFIIAPRLRLSLIGEAFNVYNASNLTEYSGDLMAPGFGQPGSRVRQVFGSGGPRSFQVAARLTF